MIFFNIANADPSIHKYAIPLRGNGSIVYVGISAKSTPQKAYFSEKQDQNMSCCFTSLCALDVFATVCINIIENGDPYCSWKNQKVEIPDSEIEFTFNGSILKMLVKNTISSKQHRSFVFTLEMIKHFTFNYWKLQDFQKFISLRKDILAYAESIVMSSDKVITKEDFCNLFLAGNQPNYVLNVVEIWRILETKYSL